MKNNHAEKRPATRGTGRKSPAKPSGRRQERPAARKRYSAAEGSVNGPAEEGPAKRTRRAGIREDGRGKGTSARRNTERKTGADGNGGRRSGTGRAAAGAGGRRFGTSGAGKTDRSGFSAGRTRTEKTGAGKAVRVATDSGKGKYETRNRIGRGSEGEKAPARRYARKTEGEETPRRRYDHSTEERKEMSGTGRARAVAYTPKPRQPKGTGEEGVRLNKFIANSGICSRREADDYITAGIVSVNDVIITELGTKVYQNDVVKFNGERIRGENKVYILMNKPKDFVTTTSDPHADKTVVSLVAGKCPERVYPVGRLDKSTTGVLLLTNDGDLAEKLTHPSFEKKKIYQVFLDKKFKSSDFKKLIEGIELEDGFIQADSLAYIDEDQSQVGVEIHSGRNRIIRRMFESLGYKVKKLDRVYFAGLTKKNLRRGQWRFLTEQEIAMLKMGSFE